MIDSYDGHGITTYVEEHLDFNPSVSIYSKYREPYNIEECIEISNKEDAAKLIEVLQYYLNMT